MRECGQLLAKVQLSDFDLILALIVYRALFVFKLLLLFLNFCGPILILAHDPEKLLTLPKRYGLNEEICPDGSSPQKSRDEHIIWCQSDEECKYSFKCTAITGLKHFGTQINYCCATKSSICSLPPQPGYGDCGKSPKLMYYFDSTALQCFSFKVIECQGINENRFGSIEECRNRCESTACEAGESPLFEDDDIDRPKLCHKNKVCPKGYKCRYDRVFRRHICCGYKSQGSCAAGLRPFMIPFAGRPQPCRENFIKDECPNDFVCSANSFTGMRYCCSLEGGVCPAGQSPYIHPLTERTIKCNPIAYAGGDCPAGYSCSASVTGSQWGFCCSDAVTASCPQSTTPYLDNVSNQPQKCTIGVSVCSSGYSCQNTDPLAIVGFCCSLGKPSALNPGRGRSLYTLEIEEKNRPLGEKALRRPLDLFNIEQWRPELRLVDIQKEIDKAEEIQILKKHSKKPPVFYNRKAQLLLSRPKCPPPMSPLLYMETSLPLSCKIGSEPGCPAPSQCIRAHEDPLHRSLCCVQADAEDIDEMLGIFPKYTSTSAPTSTTTTVPTEVVDGEVEDPENSGEIVNNRPVKVLTSSDPFCPAVIESRTCLPGSTDICVEDSFFCQFNIQFQKFMCCSLEKIDF
ncbi:hypothetical protein FO519_006722 [Halicephalobus sp. NKZ332]|nr:hypothetical protein FO519_006722 [Halicephalobus sp. NKZ332]